MLWTQSYLGDLGTKPAITNILPVIGSPLWAMDTGQSGFFFSDASGTVPVTNGQAVARVGNILGGASYFAPPVVGNSPIFVFNASPGINALRFALTPAKLLRMAGVTNPGTLFQSTTFTCAVCYRLTAAASAYHGIFTAGNLTGGQFGGGFDMLNLDTNPSGIPNLVRSGGGDSVSASLVNPAYTGDNQIWKIVFRSAPANGMELRSKSASGNFAGTGPTPSTADASTWDTSYLGASLGWGGNVPPLYPFVGDFFEFRFWNARASDALFSQLQGYLDLRWGG